MNARARNHLYSALVFVGGVALVIVLSSVLAAPHPAFSQGAGTPITGWAWSDTIGWIELNCTDTDACGTSPFGLSVDESGNVTGYAWSDNIGWVSANPSDLSGCPSAPCTATISSNGTLAGWLRTLSGEESQAGGWDGFISLSGPNYGVEQSSGVFSGFAWGDINVGWTDLEYARRGACGIGYTEQDGTCIFAGCPEYYSEQNGNCVLSSCPQNYTLEGSTCVYSGGALGGDDVGAATIDSWKVSPILVQSGGVTTVFWSAKNVESCNVQGSNGDSWSGVSGTESSSPITGQTTYTLSCTGDDDSTIATSSTVNIVPVFQER